MKNIVIEENNILKKFFRVNHKYEDFIRSEIHDNLETVINEKSYKIKTVSKHQYKNKTIYEYKIPLGNKLNCRVAFIYDDNSIYVFFISTTIVKLEFIKLIEKIKGVSKL